MAFLEPLSNFFKSRFTMTANLSRILTKKDAVKTKCPPKIIRQKRNLTLSRNYMKASKN